jgi:hypothetical protein
MTTRHSSLALRIGLCVRLIANINTVVELSFAFTSLRAGHLFL